MRRIVPKELRKKALFSCDRCKKRKIACKRIPINGNPVRFEDTTNPCTACQSKGLVCTTTIQRKKKSLGPVENLGLHYKVLVALIEGIYPDVDVNNIDVLIQIGLEQNFNMPSRADTDGDSIDELYELGHNINLNVKQEQKMETESVEFDRFILDDNGISHYIGPTSNATFLAATSEMMRNSSLVAADFGKRYDKVYKEEIIVSSIQNPLSSPIYKEIDLNLYPYVELNRETTDKHVEVFLEKIYPYYPNFDIQRFKNLYEKFWFHGKDAAKRLSCAEICFIYLIKVMGYYYLQTSNVKDEESRVVAKLVNIVTMSLAEFMLAPTRDGILCLFFLSVFLGKNKRRECGYLLITLACRQATAIGLNRQSMIECNPDYDTQEELKRIWWTVVNQEVNFSNLLGRVSSLSMKEVTVHYPNIKDDIVDLFLLHDIKLLNIVYYINQRTPHFSGTFDFNTKERAKIVMIKVNMTNWLKDAKPYLESIDPATFGFRHRLRFNYNYYLVSLLFPFLLNLASKARVEDLHEFDLEMVVECTRASIEIERTLYDFDLHRRLNPFYSPHIQYAHEAVLSLCTVYEWMASRSYNMIQGYTGRQVTINEIEQTLKSFREYNKRYSLNCRGSISKLSKYIEVMISSFYFANDVKDEFPIEGFSNQPFPELQEGDYSPNKTPYSFGFFSNQDELIDDIFFGNINL